MEKNEYYEEVIEDIVISAFDNHVKLSNSVIKSIKSKFESFYFHETWSPGLHISNLGEEIYIFECVDEWFYIQHLSTNNRWYYYKCDQLDGLIEFLKDL